MTENVKDLLAEIHRDPYAHMIAHLYADAWAQGYEDALRAARAEGLEIESAKPFTDLREEGFRRMAERQREAQATMLVALASLGRIVPSEFGAAP